MSPVADWSRFVVACLLGACAAVELFLLAADGRCHHDPSLAFCEPTPSTQETP